MYLSMNTNYYWDLPVVESIRKIAEAGFQYVELADLSQMIKNNISSKEIDKLLKTCADIGVSIEQVHGYWGEYLEEGSQKWNQRLNIFQQEIVLAHLLGIKVIVSHEMGYPKPDKGLYDAPSVKSYKEFIERNTRFFCSLLPYLEKTGVRIALENLIYPVCPTGEELMELLSSINSPFFGVCMDTAHLCVNKLNIVRFIKIVGKNLIATHISDSNNGNIDLHLFPVFGLHDNGWVDWHEVRDTLKQIGYEGIFNLEVPGQHYTTIQIRERKLKHEFGLLTDFLSGKL